MAPVVIGSLFVLIAITATVKRKLFRTKVEAHSQSASVQQTTHTNASSQGNPQTVNGTVPVSTPFTQGEPLPPRRLPPLAHNRSVNCGSSNDKRTGSRRTNASRSPAAEGYDHPDRDIEPILPPHRTPHDAPPSYDEAVLSSTVK